MQKAKNAEDKQLGERLRAARIGLGLSQAQLAKRVGLAPNHIARIESGTKTAPRFSTVARIAGELGVSLDSLSAACGWGPKPLDTDIEVSLIQNALEALRTIDSHLTAAKRAAKTASEPLAKSRRRPSKSSKKSLRRKDG